VRGGHRHQVADLNSPRTYHLPLPPSLYLLKHPPPRLESSLASGRAKEDASVPPLAEEEKEGGRVGGREGGIHCQ
jgi:hypothetical protein